MRWILGMLMAGGFVTSLMAAHGAFKSDEGRWYIQASNDTHYIGQTWNSKEECERILVSPEGEIITELVTEPGVKFFCGQGLWLKNTVAQ